jgi:hypothetical protein
VRSNIFLSFLRALKLPLKLLVGFFGKKPKREKNELEKKQLAYVRNFSPKYYWKQNFKKDKKILRKRKASFKEKSRQKSTKKSSLNTKAT